MIGHSHDIVSDIHVDVERDRDVSNIITVSGVHIRDLLTLLVVVT